MAQKATPEQPKSLNELENECLVHMAANGIPFQGALLETPPGIWNRFSIDNKTNQKDEYYACSKWEYNGIPTLSCTYGTWSGGLQEYRYLSFENNTNLSKDDYKRLIEGEELRKNEHEKHKKIEGEKRRERAQTDWKNSKDLPTHKDHATYLDRKKVKAVGLKYATSFDDSKDPVIVIPLRNIKEEVQAIQHIKADGTKRIYGLKSGNFHRLGEVKDKSTIFCVEGYATGYSVHEATGEPVVVAIDCTNLDPVINALKSKYPNHPIIIAADDDVETVDKQTGRLTNPGRTCAEKAAKKHNCSVIFPKFPENFILSNGKRPTDFNDLHVFSGIDEVKKQITEQTVFQQSSSATRLVPEQKFPLELLPPVMSRIVRLISTASKSPSEIAGTAAQALSAIALSKKVTVLEKTTPLLKHHLAFFHAVVGASAAARKSSNTGPLLKVFERYHEKEKDEHRKAMAAYTIAKKQINKLKDEIFATGFDAINLEARAHQAAELDIQAEQMRPKFYRLFATDVTGPAFIKRLNETNGCYSIFTTDGGDLIDFIIGNTSTGTNDMIFVKLITNDHIHVDRVGPNRDGVEIDVPDPCGNIFIMTQEERWSRFTNNPRLLGSGLIGRNNPAIIPPLEKGYMEEEGENFVADKQAQDDWDAMVETFLNHKEKIELRLDAEAAKRRLQLNNEWQGTVGINQENYDVSDVVHRFVSECVKRAALFHVCDHWRNLKTTPSEIPLNTLIRAIAVQKYYLQQAINDRRGALGKTEARELGKFIERWLEKSKKGKEFSGYLAPRTLQQQLHVKKDRLNAFITELEESGVIDAMLLTGKRKPYYKINVTTAKTYLAECS